MGMALAISNGVNNFIELVSGSEPDICRDARGCTVEDWKYTQIAKAGSIGAGAAAIPGFVYLTLPADVASTLRIMHRAATGICYIKLGYADNDTFAGVLAVWGKAVDLDDSLAKQIAAKSLAVGAGTVGGKLGLKMAVKGFSLCTGVLLAQKLGPKVAQKVAAKLAAKLTAKLTTGWIPVVSAAVGGGTNWWLIQGVSEAAERYSDFILQSSQQPALRQIGHASGTEVQHELPAPSAGDWFAMKGGSLFSIV